MAEVSGAGPAFLGELPARVVDDGAGFFVRKFGLGHMYERFGLEPT